VRRSVPNNAWIHEERNYCLVLCQLVMSDQTQRKTPATTNAHHNEPGTQRKRPAGTRSCLLLLRVESKLAHIHPSENLLTCRAKMP
jgi:hypothetical protein